MTRKRITIIIGIAVVTVLVTFIILSIIQITNLQTEVEEYITNVTALNEKVAEYEAEIERSINNEEKVLQLLAETGLLKGEAEKLTAAKEELEALIEGLTEEKEALTVINDGLAAANSDLVTANAKLAASNKELTAAKAELEKKMNSQSSAASQNSGAVVDEKFKITFYSTTGSYEHLIPGKTVAMNADQVAALGLKKGDEIYVISKKGWSGYYRITDHGCAYGTIDIYVNRSDIPSWGVEYDVEILI